jgi:hypothetical protein
VRQPVGLRAVCQRPGGAVHVSGFSAGREIRAEPTLAGAARGALL